MILAVDVKPLAYQSFFASPHTDVAQAVWKYVWKLQNWSADGPDSNGVVPVVLAFDSSWTHRRKAMPEYKAHRSLTPMVEEAMRELATGEPPFPSLVDVVRLSVEGYEADDVLASIARECIEQDEKCLIISPDKDLLQLVGAGIAVFDSRTRKVVTTEDVFTKIGVLPGQIPEFLALAGDSSDGIPGVPGIGEKTAAALLSRYGSIAGILAAALPTPAKSAERRVLAHESEVAAYVKLTRLECDLPTFAQGRPIWAPA